MMSTKSRAGQKQRRLGQRSTLWPKLITYRLAFMLIRCLQVHCELNERKATLKIGADESRALELNQGEIVSKRYLIILIWEKIVLRANSKYFKMIIIRNR